MDNGYQALLNHTQLFAYSTQLPLDNWEREFDIAIIARLEQGLEKQYGPRGARRLAVRCGQEFFERGLHGAAIPGGAGDLALRLLPLSSRIKWGLGAVAKVFTQLSDQVTWVDDERDYFLFHIEPCPVCWNREATDPICHFEIGILQQTVRWLSDGRHFRLLQTHCHALGHERCTFRIDKTPLR
jgi:predicted hydrocarbon binding protein